MNNKITYTIFLIAFAVLCSSPCYALMPAPPPPPPPGLEEPPPVSIDLYMLPMIGIAVVFAFYFIRKNTSN